MRRFLLLLSAWMLLSAGTAYAGGFYIPEQGVKGMGMGNAYTAIADDASAVWFNPAGIAFQDGTVVTVGADVIMPKYEFTPAGSPVTYQADKKTFFVPHGYISYKNPELPLVFGLGINAPFGLSTDWTNSGAPFTATGTPALFPATVTFSEIQMMNVNPNVAFKINDQLSLAVGAMYYNVSKVNLNNQILLLNGNGSGWGGNAALLYKGDQFNVGVSYRSRVKTDINGTGTGAGPLVAAGSTTATTSVTFPDMVNVGVSFKPAEKVTLSFDVDWTNWKTFDKIAVNFAPSALTGALGTTTSTIPENWKATTTFRAGVEWAYNDKMRARFGYVYDPTPINNVDFSPRLPGNDRQLFTVGYGYDANDSTTLDLAYAYVLLNNRTQTASAAPFYNGRYKSSTHIVAADITAHF